MSAETDEFERLLARWPEPEIGDPPGRTTFVGQSDDADPPTSRKMSSDLEGMTIGIVYRDASGSASERTIRCLMLVQSAGALYIQAHCKLRNASRTFRMDRIEAVIDYSTGEFIGGVAEFFQPFISDLRESATKPARPRARAERREGPMLQLYGAGATVLAYVAAVDGHTHAAEMARIEAYVDLRLSIMEGDRVQRDLSRQWLRNLLPTRDMAVKAMRKVAADDTDAALLSEALIDIISIDGEVTDDEMDFARQMIDILARKRRKIARQSGAS